MTTLLFFQHFPNPLPAPILCQLYYPPIILIINLSVKNNLKFNE